MQFFSPTVLLALLTFSTTIFATPLPAGDDSKALVVAGEDAKSQVKAAKSQPTYLWFKKGNSNTQIAFRLWFKPQVSSNTVALALSKVKNFKVGTKKVWMSQATMDKSEGQRKFIVGLVDIKAGKDADAEKAVTKEVKGVLSTESADALVVAKDQTFNTEPTK